MRRLCLLSTLVLTVLLGSPVSAQDFSNKGKDFWVGYGYHERMVGGSNSQEMVLYFATDQVTNITITIPGTGYTQTITTPGGNSVTTSATIPKTAGPSDARLLTEGLHSKGIHITSDKAMVAYAHIYNQNVSGATILYPTNTLGRQCYSVNYKNWSNLNNSNSWFYVVAADTGTTTVEITPSANTTGGWLAGVTYTVNLTQGQIYNVMGVLTGGGPPPGGNPFTGVDLTGSKIESINTGSGCKKIAVFSGSGRISITCNNNSSSSDNYMVQAMPKNAWGKKYLTVQANGNQSNNIYRVCVSNPAAIVRINGAITALPLINNFYYEIPATNQPQLIESDSVIMVAQYFTSQNACGNGNPGDPEVIYLSAVEQNINTVLWNATPNFAITAHSFNVVIPNTGTALSSFTLDGAPLGGFIPHPQDPGYSYLRQSVAPGSHIIHSDSGFNAIAYGFGNVESYGYNAGTNIKDLYQQIGVTTEYGIEPTPSVCTNSPFKFKVSLPYCADSITWDLSNLPGPPSPSLITMVYSTCTPGAGGPDSTTVVNGRTIYWYSLPSYYNFNIAGIFPVNMLTYSPNGECGTVQEIDFDLTVSNPPVADFTWVSNGCVTQPVQFIETTPQVPKPTYSFWWDFGDPPSGPANNSNLRNPTHLFSGPGTYTVRYAAITTPGCLTDTVSHQVTVDPLPTALFSVTPPLCPNVPVTFTDQSTPGGSSTPLAQWTWDFGDGSPIVVRTTSTNEVHTYTVPGTYNATLQVETSTGCQSTVFTFPVVILPDGTITLSSAPGTDNQTVCINTPIINITYAIGGSGTGGSVTGLPAGVTGTYAGGVITITGTPTVAGTFNYTVNTTGPCVNPTANGTITVTPDGTLTLTSAPGTDNQTVCINTPIVNITYAVGGSGTGGSVTGLPAGVTGTNAGGVITIAGTPTVAGTFNYTVNTTGPCVNPTANGTITVTPDGTVTLTSAPGTDNQTVCINTPIINITYAIGGSGTGGSVTGLPAGVTGTFAGGVITISGTPTVTGTFNYTVNTTGPCVNPSITGTITVTPDGTVTLTSAPGTDNQTVCINTPIVNITYAVGGSGTGGSVTGLPAGVTGTYAGGVITIAGTPTVAGTFNYNVNTTGPCVNPTANGTITVTPDGTVTLTSAPGTDNQTVCINTPIINITYAIGGSGTGGSVTGLPAGVTGTYAGGVITITGTPTVAGTFNYTVNTTGPCVNPTANGTITVTSDGTVTLTSAPGTDNQTVCINTPIVNITYAVGGSGTGGSVTGLPAGVTGSFAGGVITITGTPTAAGTFNYTVNTTGPCVNPTANGTITVTPDGTLTLTSAPGTDNQTVCINTPIINITYAIGGSGTGGSVSGLPPGVTGTFAGGVITISGTPTTTAGSPFTYTVNTTGPCVNPSTTGTITVDPDATITLTSGSGTNAQELCVNAALTNITYSVGGGGSGATVAGLPAGVTGSYAGGTFTISGTPTVSGTFNYTVTTTGICVQATATGSILVNALPTANFSASTPSCETGLILFTDLSVANSGIIVSWAWDFGDGGTSTLQNPTHTYASAGTYTVTLIVTTDKGCVSTTPAQQVTIYAKPLAGYIVPEVCLNDTYAQFTDTSTVAAPDNITLWDWDFGDGGTSTLQNPLHSYTATGAYTVRLIVTSNRGCRDTVIHTVFVNGSFPLANFAVQNPATLCANDSVAIVEASTVFPGTITKVEIYWDNVGAPAVFDTDNSPFTGKVYKHLYPNFQAPLTRVFTIRYRAYSGGVCVDDTLRNITVNAAPLVQFTPIPNICLDAAPYQITQASEIGGVPGSGVFSGPGVSPTGLFTPSVAGPGTHNIKYKFTSSAAGCMDSLTQTIKVWIPPTADFTVSSPACERQAMTFDGGISASTEGTLTQWRWNFGDGTPVVIRTSGAPFTHTFNSYGIYNVQLNVVTSNSCVSTPKIITVDVKPLARPNFTFPAISCLPNANVLFTNTTTIPDGSAMTYYWDFGDPGSGAVNNSTGTSPSHTYVSTGPYNVNLQVTNATGCVHDTTIALNSIHPQPIASFITDKVDVCIGGSITFTNTSNPMDGTLLSLNWDMADGNIRTTPSFSHTYVATGQYIVSLYIYNSFNCKSTTFTQTVSINPYPPVNAGPSKFMLDGGQVQLTPTVNTSLPVTYLWTPGRWLSDSTILMPIARPPDDMYFRLTVTSDKGCSAWDTMFVKVLKKPDIPNIFSPNGDGVNDRWEIKYLESYPGCTVEIVNRYGQLVFRSAGYDKPWDGKINGTDAPVGTYYYVVSPKNGRAPLTGYVDLIR